MRGLRIVLWIVAIGALLGGVGLYLAGQFNDAPGMTFGMLLLMASFAVYAVPLLGIAALTAAGMLFTPRTKRIRPALVLLLALALLPLAAWRYLPLYSANAEPSSGAQKVTVMTANLRMGQSDMGVVLNKARLYQADIVVLQEVTPQAWEIARGAADVLRYYGYHAGEAQPGVFGTMILSRTDLPNAQPVAVSNRGFMATTDLGGPIRVIGVHTTPPNNAAAWRQDFATITQTVQAGSEPTIMAGDFNATIDHRAMRDMLATTGLVDAVDACGSGWQPTWPTPGSGGLRGLAPVPLVPIDHVFFSSHFACVDTQIVDLEFTDHRAVVAVPTPKG